jgi:hypothetical protein
VQSIESILTSNLEKFGILKMSEEDDIITENQITESQVTESKVTENEQKKDIDPKGEVKEEGTNQQIASVGESNKKLETAEPIVKKSEFVKKSEGESNKVIALYDYTSSGKKNPLGEGDISFTQGDVMIVLEKRGTNWLLVERNGVIGLVPANYVQDYSKGVIISNETNVSPPKVHGDLTKMPSSNALLPPRLSEAMSPAAIRGNLKEGFLMKRGEIYKNWKMRWFVLKSDGFYYYEQQPDSNPKNWTPIKVIPLSLCITVAPISDREKEGLKLPKAVQNLFLFKIVSSKRDWLVATTSQSERDEWLNIAKQAIQTFRMLEKGN